MRKPIVYANIPGFDQQTRAVYQLEPVDMGDHVYVGVEIVEIPEVEGSEGE